MAEDLDDGEFWLPSEFLADDIHMEKKENGGNDGNENRAAFPLEFPYGYESFGSSLSSPDESVVGSTETESDEDDYMAGLTKQMAHFMLQEEEKSPPACGNDNQKGRTMAGSPQSTLVGSWSGWSLNSSRGSSNGPSEVSSPPSTPLEQKDDAWDLLSAAAGQVVRLKMNDGGSKVQGPGLLGSSGKLTTLPIATPVKAPSANLCQTQATTQQHFQANQFQQLKQQQMMKQQCAAVWGRQGKVTSQHQLVQNRGKHSGYGNGRCRRPLGLSSSAWSPLQQQQQQPGSGMRALFLGGNGSRKESCGTGVFLPRRVGNPMDMRKKPACPTVLLPARVVQALNLNLDEMGNALPRFHVGFIRDHEPVAARTNAPPSQQKRNNLRHQPLPPSHEVRLPSEWTY